jgi:tRNA A-37 threonylcarbamoyl transferase component Bud32
MRTIEPHAPTPVPHGVWSALSTTGGLPDDMLNEQVGRLTVFAGVAIGLWTFGLLMEHVARFTMLTVPGHSPARAQLIEVVGIILSIALFLYARYSRHTPQTKTDVGLGTMVVNAFLISMLNSWAIIPTARVLELSWITVLVLVYAMTAPSTPMKTLVASLVAASMDPLGVWLAHLRGTPVPSVWNTVLVFMPNYSCAVVATLSARAIHRLGRDIRRAREMGRYQLTQLLGHGGMGEVWRAQHRMLARNVAVKLIRPEVLGASTPAEAKLMVQRFEREARATAALSSPHTIRVFDFGTTDAGHFYYVMELLAGRDLESLVREFGPVPADRALYLLRQVCHSLADAHARGLVHRDIKPANIYACRMGLDYDFVKVLDFGLVKFADRTAMQQTLMTAAHTTTGTPAYMAPELILGETDIDRRADVYALGCVAYYLLTGQLVFDADTPMKMFLQHVQTKPVPPSQRVELRIPPELDELVLACLEKDPAKRPQDAAQLFTMARDCRTCEHWSSERARIWWEQHLLELTGPLTLSEPQPQITDPALAIH